MAFEEMNNEAVVEETAAEVVSEATETVQEAAEAAPEAGAERAERTDRAERPYRGGDRGGERSEGPRRRMPRRRRKVCVFCGKDNFVDYKDAAKMRKYISERGKILPRRVTGNCAKHQRAVTLAVKRARHLAILPYVED